MIVGVDADDDYTLTSMNGNFRAVGQLKALEEATTACVDAHLLRVMITAFDNSIKGAGVRDDAAVAAASRAATAAAIAAVAIASCDTTDGVDASASAGRTTRSVYVPQ